LLAIPELRGLSGYASCKLLSKVEALEQTVAAQRAAITRLKGLKGRPALKPSGNRMKPANTLSRPLLHLIKDLIRYTTR